MMKQTLVMQYNIQSGRDRYGALDIGQSARVIASVSPDIVALNEIRRFTSDIGGADQAAQLRDALKMEMAFGKTIPYLGGEYGIGLLSKWPILSSRVVPVPDLSLQERDKTFEPRAVLVCDILLDGDTVRVFVTHAGLSAGERRMAVDTLAALLRENELPALVMGDFNMTPADPTFEPMLRYVRDTSAMRPEPRTHPSDMPHVKIDYIFATPHWQAEPAWTLQTLASDHLPLLARLTRG